MRRSVERLDRMLECPSYVDLCRVFQLDVLGTNGQHFRLGRRLDERIMVPSPRPMRMLRSIR